MAAIEFTVGIVPFGLILGAVFITGFALRSRQLGSCKKKVLDLEREMLNNHAAILDLQREKAEIIKQMKESRIPVIPLIKLKEDNNKNRQAK